MCVPRMPFGVLFVAALPWMARPLVAGTLSAALGRPVSIAALRWDASAYSVVADDIHIGSAPEELTIKRVTVVVASQQDAASCDIIVKGAFANVLDACTALATDAGDLPLDETQRRQLEAYYRERGAKGPEVEPYARAQRPLAEHEREH